MQKIKFKFHSRSHRQQLQQVVKFNVGVIMGVLCAVSKQVLAAAPNFQIVTFWLMMVVTIMSATVIWVTVNGFCCINVLLNGLALWSLTYFMIFNFFAVVGILTRKLILRW